MLRSKIDLIYIDAGGGHRAAVTALDEVIREQQRPWETRLRNIQDLLHSIDVIRKLTGIPFQEVYNIMLRRGWTLGTAQLIPPMHLAIRIFHDARGARAGRALAPDPPGHGGLADPALQPRHQRGAWRKCGPPRRWSPS